MTLMSTILISVGNSLSPWKMFLGNGNSSPEIIKSTSNCTGNSKESLEHYNCESEISECKVKEMGSVVISKHK